MLIYIILPYHMKTFVYHDGALGDLLLSLPCLERVKAGSGTVHLAGRADIVRFLKKAGAVDAASSSDQSLFASLYAEIDTRLRTFLSGFDKALIFTAVEQPAAAAAIRSVVPDTRVIRTIPPGGTGLHAARYRLSQLDPEALLSIRDAVLNIPPEEADIAQELLRKAGHHPGTRLIAVHPGSGGRPKCWPVERYFEVIERLQSESESFIILFTGEAENRELREAVSRYSNGRKNTLHAAGLELMSAASLLSSAGLYIGNDSGFSHLAGILGCASVVLFGPTDPVRWKPLGPRVNVVAPRLPGPIENVEIDDVIAGVRSTIRMSG